VQKISKAYTILVFRVRAGIEVVAKIFVELGKDNISTDHTKNNFFTGSKFTTHNSLVIAVSKIQIFAQLTVANTIMRSTLTHSRPNVCYK